MPDIVDAFMKKLGTKDTNNISKTNTKTTFIINRLIPAEGKPTRFKTDLTDKWNKDKPKIKMMYSLISKVKTFKIPFTT